MIREEGTWYVSQGLREPCFLYPAMVYVFMINCWSHGFSPYEVRRKALVVKFNDKIFNITYNDLVDVIMGTGHGIAGKKCEPLKARFKRVVETERGIEFLCRLLVGSTRGPCPQYPRHSVFKLSAFGACAIGSC
jgi:hypothetical protein